MVFNQYYLDCLSHASYLVGDEISGRAVVVDPQRDVTAYLADAKEAGLTIEHVIETHFHADFVSGHLELAEATGADICYGDAAEADFPIRRLFDGERLRLGDLEIEVRATPGHTPESISLVVYERVGDEVPYGVLTGDTLFVGDVGRPDLAAIADPETDASTMARQLYHSLHSRLLSLPDGTRVFPAHGAGSSCGRALSTERQSTIGEQRKVNYALAPMDEDDFVKLITEGQRVTPAYFAYDAARNRELRPLLDEAQAPRTLTLQAVLSLQAEGAVVLDARSPQAFAAGHLKGSINVGLAGRFAEYAGDVIGPDTPIVLVAAPGTELQAKVRLARIGFDRVEGYLAEPLWVFFEHPDVTERSTRLTADELEHRRATVPGLVLLDVRNPGEVASGSIEGSLHIALPELCDNLDALDPAQPVVVYCASGFRSSIGASLLSANGFVDVADLIGGFNAWQTRDAS